MIHSIKLTAKHQPTESERVRKKLKTTQIDSQILLKPIASITAYINQSFLDYCCFLEIAKFFLNFPLVFLMTVVYIILKKTKWRSKKHNKLISADQTKLKNGNATIIKLHECIKWEAPTNKQKIIGFIDHKISIDFNLDGPMSSNASIGLFPSEWAWEWSASKYCVIYLFFRLFCFWLFNEIEIYMFSNTRIKWI